ncbi:MAG: hypothetical protein K0U98_11555 [Deltaproteobacteria bacterium]|nr:hypothetical protein [Deltaproteobacteria bacterium]
MKKFLAISTALTAGVIFPPQVQADHDPHDLNCVIAQNLSHQRAEAGGEGLSFSEWLDALLDGALGTGEAPTADSDESGDGSGSIDPDG